MQSIINLAVAIALFLNTFAPALLYNQIYSVPNSTFGYSSSNSRDSNLSKSEPQLNTTTSSLPNLAAEEQRYRLILSSQKYKPGKDLKVNWKIEGPENLPANSQLQLVFTLPAGFKAIENTEALFDQLTNALVVDVYSNHGQLTLSTSQEIQEAVITASLKAGETTLAEARLPLVQGTKTRVNKGGGEAVGLNGKVKVKFPKDALPKDVDITIAPATGVNAPFYGVIGEPFELLAESAEDQTSIHIGSVKSIV